MAQAAFHKNQRVFVKPVGTWAIVERVLPQWVKGLDAPLRVHYDVGLGREFSASELVADAGADPLSDTELTASWRIKRAPNRRLESSESPHHPHPGTYPIITTDEKSWGGWRVPSAEYDRDPHRIEFQARVIECAPHLMQSASALVRYAQDNREDLPAELLSLAKAASALLRRIYDTTGEVSVRTAAE